MTLFAPVDGQPPEACLLGERQVYVADKYMAAPVYERLNLAVGSVISGPAIMEQSDTTIFVDPGLRATVDRYGNLVITECA